MSGPGKEIVRSWDGVCHSKVGQVANLRRLAKPAANGGPKRKAPWPLGLSAS